MVDLLSSLDANRVVDDLRTLATLTGDTRGAQRVAWTEPWVKARRWLSGELAALAVHEEIDEAGNQWATLRGASDRSIILGGHLDSVPDGGWLDGALNVLSALAILRACAAAPTLPLSVRLVNWADEEGRFGHSLLGSSAAGGLLDSASVAGLRDASGAAAKDVLAAFDVDIETVGASARQIANAVAYLELHIEQGPVLWQSRRSLGVVTGTKGVRRSSVRFVGHAAHSGSTPMRSRSDALVAAARFIADVRDLAVDAGSDAVATVGVIRVEPAMPTVIPGECVVVIDQRSIDESLLGRLRAGAVAASERVAHEEGVTVSWTSIYDVPATPFDATLIDICDRAASAVAGDAHRMPSGPLHDATAMARAGIPTGMIFVPSIRGLSHVVDEDTAEDDIRQGVRAECRALELCLAELAAS